MRRCSLIRHSSGPTFGFALGMLGLRADVCSISPAGRDDDREGGGLA